MATIIYQNGTKEARNFNCLKDYQDLVGGYVEVVYLGGEDILIIDEEGKLKGKGINRLATDLTTGILADWDVVVGDVILTTREDFDRDDFDDNPSKEEQLKEQTDYEAELANAEVADEKVWSKDEIKEKILNSQEWLERGILAIYKLQTLEEQHIGGTVENNGVGFSGSDSHFMSYVARWLESGKTLSGDFLEKSRNKMLKYAGQLTRIANKQIR